MKYLLTKRWEWSKVWSNSMEDSFKKTLTISLRFEKRDVWVGAYWGVVKTTAGWSNPYQRNIGGLVIRDFYVCLVPCFPLHINYCKQEIL